MRLLVVTDSLGNGGAERQLNLTLTNLPEQLRVRCFSLAGWPFDAYLSMSGKTRFVDCLRDCGGGFAGLMEAVASVSTAAEVEVRFQ